MRRRSIRAPAPPGYLGTNYPDVGLPDDPLLDDWWPWRRCELNWETLKSGAESTRADVRHVAQSGFRSSFSAFFGSCQFMIQVLPEIFCDGFACESTS